MKILIVGGVAGGATAAARLRRLDETAEIIIFERSGYVSYANCGLPYYIGGEIADENELLLQTSESLWERYRIDVRTRHEVTHVDPDRKTVTVYGADTGKIYEESYDKLILSPGARPIVPDFADGGNEKIFTLRTVEDTFRIKVYIEKNKPESAAVIGGGFIGIEMAENLKSLGMQVTVIQKGEHLLSSMDGDMASFIHAKFRAEGINVLLRTNVTAVSDTGGRLKITTESTAPIYTDMLLVSVGVSPENTLAKDAGLALGEKGAIAVNESMQTSNGDIYAVGDAVEVTHRISKNKAVISLAGPANKQGRIAADAICGLKSKYSGSLGSSVIKIFDITAASAGLNEQQIKRAGIPYEKVVLSPLSHAGYYPGAKVMTLKVLYEKGSLRILGAQAIGYEGIDKRIDVLAAAMCAGLTADKLKELELAYAPPYSSAKDPVNMAGFIIDNIENGIVKQFHYADIQALRDREDVILLDTRTAGEYAGGHAEGFIHMPLDEIRERLGELDKSKSVYVMCQSGLRSYIAVRILMQNGFDAYNFSGGYRFYSSVHSDRLASEQAYPCGMEK